MGKPDALSRRADHNEGTSDNLVITVLKPFFFAIRALEAVLLVGEERGMLNKIRKANWEGKQEEAVAKAAHGLKKGRSGLVRAAEWSVHNKGLLHFQGKIYVPNVNNLRQRIVDQHHDLNVGGHPGR